MDVTQTKKFWLKVGLLLIPFFITYYPTVLWMVDRWRQRDSYYAHGFLIPPVIIYLIWRKRRELQDSPIEPYKRGLWLFLLGLAIHLLSGLLFIGFTSGFSTLLVISGAILYLLGKRILGIVLFPLLLLVFMIPLPMSFIADLSLSLKLLATTAALFALNLFGVIANREGSIILLENATLTIGDVCSGLRSIISLLFLGALMAYLWPLPLNRKVVLFLFSIPIAMISNVLRVLILCVIAHFGASEGLVITAHNITGILIFIFAIAGLAITGKLLQLVTAREKPVLGA